MVSVLSKYVSYDKLERFWQRITQRYDKKLDSVTNSDDTVEVLFGREIAVKVSPRKGNLLKVDKGKGLVVDPLHTLTFGSDQNYTYDGTEDVTVPVYQGSVDNE